MPPKPPPPSPPCARRKRKKRPPKARREEEVAEEGGVVALLVTLRHGDVDAVLGEDVHELGVVRQGDGRAAAVDGGELKLGAILAEAHALNLSGHHRADKLGVAPVVALGQAIRGDGGGGGRLGVAGEGGLRLRLELGEGGGGGASAGGAKSSASAAGTGPAAGAERHEGRRGGGGAVLRGEGAGGGEGGRGQSQAREDAVRCVADAFGTSEGGFSAEGGEIWRGVGVRSGGCVVRVGGKMPA